MAEPSFAGGIAAQVIFECTNGIPRDSVVNTFHFNTNGHAGSDVEKLEWVRDHLFSFYNDTHHTSVSNIASWLSATLSRSANKAHLKLYWMSDPHPRQPISYDWTLGAVASGDNGLPVETCLCLSQYSNLLHTKSGRGRVYIGPLHSNSVRISAGNVFPFGDCIDPIRYGGRYLIDESTASGSKATWSIYSRKLNEMHPVDTAFVDNEFDTQRRRGHRATVRNFA
jgi:hypothetical protein